MNAQQPEVETSLSPFAAPGAGSPDPIRPGAPCPNCGKGKLDYNGLLELECDRCGYTISSGAGCT